ncbi:hypothetical protein pipiens_013431 [Culex pipiens pipiens]|uniref:Uncharacterized protein n=1 Tax=Culex pipiens pipiens TaxID=38569 RepID=A0ABD1CYE8_CULPP
MPRRTIEQSPAYTHRERSLARSRLASRHQQLAEPDTSALGNGNLRKGHEAGQDGTIRRKARTKLPIGKPSSERPKSPTRTRRHASAVSKDEPDLKRTREAELESGGGRRDASHAKNHKRLRVTTHTRTTEARFSVKVTPTRKQV